MRFLCFRILFKGRYSDASLASREGKDSNFRPTTTLDSKMTEPPTKRARRVDSSTMWELNDRRTHSPTPISELDRSPRRESHGKEDAGRRDGTRNDRRFRSRSRDRRDPGREMSRSRDRRDRDRDRRDRNQDGRSVRDRERSTSRDRQFDRRGKGFFYG